MSTAIAETGPQQSIRWLSIRGEASWGEGHRMSWQQSTNDKKGNEGKGDWAYGKLSKKEAITTEARSKTEPAIQKDGPLVGVEIVEGVLVYSAQLRSWASPTRFSRNETACVNAFPLLRKKVKFYIYLYRFLSYFEVYLIFFFFWFPFEYLFGILVSDILCTCPTHINGLILMLIYRS